MKNHRTFLRIFFILIVFGVMNLLSLLGRPILSNSRTVDLIHVFGIGMCFGGAIIALVAYFRGRHLSGIKD